MVRGFSVWGLVELARPETVIVAEAARDAISLFRLRR